MHLVSYRQKRWTSIVLTVLLMITSLFTPGWVKHTAAAVADHVVISEIYGGGGNANAPFTHDYIVLYNPTNQEVNLNGFSVQYASATGTFNNQTNLTGSIKAQGYFLIRQQGGSNGAPLPVDPDVIGSINMSAATGKVALARTTTKISGKDDPNVVDFVGFGTANEYWGSKTAPAPSNTSSITRKANDGSNPGPGKGNGWDTSDNGNDFVTMSPPVPKSSQSPTEPGEPGGPTDPPEVTSIIELRGTDSNGNSLKLGQTFTIEGIVTIDNGILGTQNSNFYMQDDTAGINIFGGVAHGLSIKKGDRLRVTGQVAFYNGLTELVPTAVEKLGTAELPDPMASSIADLNNFVTAELLEGSLVTLPGKVTNIPSPDSGGSYNITIVDENSLATTLRVVSKTGIDVPTALQLNKSYVFTGLVGQFKSSAPYTSGYQLFPRDNEDISEFVPFTFIHEPMSQAYQDTDIRFNAISDGADSINLYYKSLSATEYSSVEMTRAGDHLYEATLSASVIPAQAFHYYIEAKAGDQVKSSGTATVPHLVTLIMDKEGPAFYGEVPINGSKIEMKRPKISVQMDDPSGIDLLSAKIWLDDVDVTAQASINHQQIAFTPIDDLLIGVHGVRVEAADLKGNYSSYSWSFELLARFTGGNHYRGTTHNHTKISSDAAGEPVDALKAAKKYHYDWFAFSDHSHSIDAGLIGQDTVDHNGMPERTGGADWQLTKHLADQYTVNDQFVVFPAFEMTATTWGHSNVFGTENFIDRKQNNGMYQDLSQYYAWVLTYDNIVAQFNHPSMGKDAFNNFRPYNKEVDQFFTMLEVGNGSGHYSYTNAEKKFYDALDLGWHLAPTFGEDNHDATWGQTNRRTIIVANDLSQESLLQSMRNMRVYMAEDPNFTLDVLANGYYMGSTVDSNELQFTINGSDLIAESPSHPDYHYLPAKYKADDRIAKVELVTNGGKVVASTQPMTTDFTWSPTYTVSGGQQWFVVKVTQMDGDRIYSAPIWSKEEKKDVKITSLDVEGDSISAGIPATLHASLANYGTESVSDIVIQFYYDQVDAEHLIGEQTIHSLASKAVTTASARWDHPVSGNHTLIATLSSPNNPDLDEQQFSKPIQIRDPLGITVMIDASHGNENTATDLGTYKDNLKEFTKLLHKEGYSVVENKALITSEMLSQVRVLLLTHPRTAYSADELNAINHFVQNGGSLLLTSKSNFNANPDVSNSILEQLGTTIRINNDGIFDDSRTGNFWSDPLQAKHAVRLHPGLVSNYLTDRVPTLDYFSGASLESVGHQPLQEDGNLVIIASGNETTYQNNIKGGGYVYDNVSDESGGSAIPAIATDLVGNGRLFVSGMNVFNDLQMDQSYEPKGNVQFLLNVVNWLADRGTEVLSITEARALEDLNDVVVEGTVTTAAGVFFDAFYMQDDTGGIMVFNEVPEGSLQLGDRVRVYGRLITFENNRELEFSRFAHDVIRIGHTDPIEPRTVSTGEASRDEHQGMLIKVTGTVISKFDDHSYVIDDGSGEILVFTDGYIVNQSGPVPDLAIGDTLEAVGLAGKYAEGNRVRVRDSRELRKVDGGSEAVTHITARPSKSVVEPNESFTIQIDFSATTNLYSAQFSLTYDENATIGEVIAGEELTAFQRNHNPNAELLIDHKQKELGNGKLRSDYLVSLLGVEDGYTGSGALANFTFSSAVLGNFDFELSDVRMLDSEGGDVQIGELRPARVTVSEHDQTFVISGRVLAEALLDVNGSARVDFSQVWYEGEDGMHRVVVQAIDNAGRIITGTVHADGAYQLRVPTGNYTIEAAVPGHFGSSTTLQITGNQTHLFTLKAGDLNDDGVIDLQDLQIAARAFGQQAPWLYARYSIADLNRDGAIDLLDISYILNNFNMHR